MHKMVKILWIISLIVIAHASKEKLQDLDQLLDDPNIWQYIEKRVEQEKKDDIPIENNHDDSVGDVDPPKQKIELQNRHQNFRQPYRASENERHYPNYRNQHNFHETNPYGLKTLSDSSGNACSYNLNSSVIIKSKSSLDNGAAYLKNAFNLSAKECAKKCCYTQNCNLAVYEEKEEHSCYLFDCGTPSKCVFAHHGNYSVMSFQINDFMPSAHQQYHENELENLGKVKPPTPSPPPPTTHTPTPYPQRAKVPLYGDCDIDWDEKCVDRNAECRDEQCKCKKGYHAIYAICREVCNEDEFQCKNKGQDFDVPDCIDSKHRCDGVPQCADGSDEEKCPKKPEENIDSKTEVKGNQGTIAENGGLPSLSNKIASKAIQNPVPKNQSPLLPNSDKISGNQFYGQVPDKTGFINPNLYGSNNPLLPQQMQDYYWPPQQGLLNNPQQYQSPYSDYPQFQGQQLGQGYLNPLGYGGQKFNNPFNSGLKTDNTNLNSKFYGAYGPNQNVPLQKYPLNQVYDKNAGNDMNQNYQDSVKPLYGDLNVYPNYNNLPRNRQPSLLHEGRSNNKTNVNKQPVLQPNSTSTTKTSTTSTTTTTTTASPVVMTTRKSVMNDNSYIDENYYPGWSENDDSYYHNNRQHKNQESTKHISQKGQQNFKDSDDNRPYQNSGNNKQFKDSDDNRPYQNSDNNKQFEDSGNNKHFADSDNKHFEDSGNNKHFDDSGNNKHFADLDNNKHFEDSGNNKHFEDSDNNNKHYIDSGDNRNYKESHNNRNPKVSHDNKHYKTKVDNSGNENYRNRYPYRFRQKGKYSDYDDNTRYNNWPDYYDDGSDYSEFRQQQNHRPGKDYYENIFAPDKQSNDKDEIHEDKVNTPSPPKPVVDQPEEKQPDVPDESDKDIPLETDVKDEDKDQQSEADSKEKEPVDDKPDDKPETATKSTSTMSETPKDPTETEKNVGLEAPKKVVIKSPTDNNQGPIVALALGLGICLMLLIFVGCRLRTVKRKIRRGKSLHSNEADYLINGMYL
ncbi:uncharacterized protein LOC143068836 isoform X4 [Mytilus galloprovincialis]|uniref:uncharacterized protein LOC143068836 isoform X4 n=1 Tax=Mytilus galloprovincialis TaxID=29158 RepID=UPI003F7B7293